MAWCAYTSFQSPFFHNNDDDDDNNNFMCLQHWFIPQSILYGIEVFSRDYFFSIKETPKVLCLSCFMFCLYTRKTLADIWRSKRRWRRESYQKEIQFTTDKTVPPEKGHETQGSECLWDPGLSSCSSGWLGAGAKMYHEYFCSYHWLIVIKSCELYVTLVSWFRCRRKSNHNRDTERQSKRKTKKC